MASDNEASCEGDPNFAVICGFLEKFGVLCGLNVIDFVELQEMLENTQEVPPALANLHVKLLRKIRKSVPADKWERAIIKICHSCNSQDAWELERFGYKKSRIASKLRILKQLLEMQFDLNVKFKNDINKMSAEQLRTQPLGKDKLGHAYWYQSDETCQIRVYKEDPDEETWDLIAKDRDGLVSLISQLGSNDTIIVGSEPILNEDSNSLEIEKPILDTGQNDSNSSNSKPSKKSSEDESNEETDGANEIKLTDDDKSDISKIPESEPTILVEEKEVVVEEKVELPPRPLGLRLKPLTELLSQPALDNEKKPELSGIKEKYIRSDSFTSPTLHRKAVDSAGFDTAGFDAAYRNDMKRSVDYEIEELTVKRPRPARPTLLVNKKKPYTEDGFPNEEEEVEEYGEYYHEELGDEIQEPLMLVRGEGSGCDNNSGVEIGEAIEEPVLFVYGEGNGADCKAAPEIEQPIREEINFNVYEVGEAIEDPVFYVYGEGAGFDCNAGPEKEQNEDNDNLGKNESDENSIKTIGDPCTSPSKNSYKLGTVIDTKKVEKKEALKSPAKKSRWDIGKPDQGDNKFEYDQHSSNEVYDLTLNTQKLVDKFENITKTDSEHTEIESPNKSAFFFGPGSAFSFTPPKDSPIKSTFVFGASQKSDEVVTENPDQTSILESNEINKNEKCVVENNKIYDKSDKIGESSKDLKLSAELLIEKSKDCEIKIPVEEIAQKNVKDTKLPSEKTPEISGESATDLSRLDSKTKTLNIADVVTLEDKSILKKNEPTKSKSAINKITEIVVDASKMNENVPSKSEIIMDSSKPAIPATITDSDLIRHKSLKVTEIIKVKPNVDENALHAQIKTDVPADINITEIIKEENTGSGRTKSDIKITERIKDKSKLEEKTLHAPSKSAACADIKLTEVIKDQSKSEVKGLDVQTKSAECTDTKVTERIKAKSKLEEETLHALSKSAACADIKVTEAIKDTSKSEVRGLDAQTKSAVCADVKVTEVIKDKSKSEEEALHAETKSAACADIKVKEVIKDNSKLEEKALHAQTKSAACADIKVKEVIKDKSKSEEKALYAQTKSAACADIKVTEAIKDKSKSEEKALHAQTKSAACADIKVTEGIKDKEVIKNKSKLEEKALDAQTKSAACADIKFKAVIKDTSKLDEKALHAQTKSASCADIKVTDVSKDKSTFEENPIHAQQTKSADVNITKTIKDKSANSADIKITETIKDKSNLEENTLHAQTKSTISADIKVTEKNKDTSKLEVTTLHAQTKSTISADIKLTEIIKGKSKLEENALHVQTKSDVPNIKEIIKDKLKVVPSESNLSVEAAEKSMDITKIAKTQENEIKNDTKATLSLADKIDKVKAKDPPASHLKPAKLVVDENVTKEKKIVVEKKQNLKEQKSFSGNSASTNYKDEQNVEIMPVQDKSPLVTTSQSSQKSKMAAPVTSEAMIETKEKNDLQKAQTSKTNILSKPDTSILKDSPNPAILKRQEKKMTIEMVTEKLKDDKKSTSLISKPNKLIEPPLEMNIPKVITKENTKLPTTLEEKKGKPIATEEKINRNKIEDCIENLKHDKIEEKLVPEILKPKKTIDDKSGADTSIKSKNEAKLDNTKTNQLDDRIAVKETFKNISKKAEQKATVDIKQLPNTMEVEVLNKIEQEKPVEIVKEVTDHVKCVDASKDRKGKIDVQKIASTSENSGNVTKILPKSDIQKDSFKTSETIKIVDVSTLMDLKGTKDNSKKVTKILESSVKVCTKDNTSKDEIEKPNYDEPLKGFPITEDIKKIVIDKSLSNQEVSKISATTMVVESSKYVAAQVDSSKKVDLIVEGSKKIDTKLETQENLDTKSDIPKISIVKDQPPRKPMIKIVDIAELRGPRSEDITGSRSSVPNTRDRNAKLLQEQVPESSQSICSDNRKRPLINVKSSESLKMPKHKIGILSANTTKGLSVTNSTGGLEKTREFTRSSRSANAASRKTDQAAETGALMQSRRRGAVPEIEKNEERKIPVEITKTAISRFGKSDRVLDITARTNSPSNKSGLKLTLKTGKILESDQAQSSQMETGLEITKIPQTFKTKHDLTENAKIVIEPKPKTGIATRNISIQLNKKSENLTSPGKLVAKTDAIEITRIVKKIEPVSIKMVKSTKTDVNVEKLLANTSVTINKVAPIERKDLAVKVKSMDKKDFESAQKSTISNIAALKGISFTKVSEKNRNIKNDAQNNVIPVSDTKSTLKITPTKLKPQPKSRNSTENLASLGSVDDGQTNKNNVRSLRSRGVSRVSEVLPQKEVDPLPIKDNSDVRNIRSSRSRFKGGDKTLDIKDIEEQIIPKKIQIQKEISIAISSKEKVAAEAKIIPRVTSKGKIVPEAKATTKGKCTPKEIDKPVISLRSSRRQKEQLEKKPSNDKEIVKDIAEPKPVVEPICVKKVVQDLTDDTQIDNAPESTDIFNDAESDGAEIGEDALSSTESLTEMKATKKEKKAITSTSLSFDYNESPIPTTRSTRKRGRVSPIPPPIEISGKRRKTRGKRIADNELRKSIEEKKQEEASSSEEEKVNKKNIKPTPKKIPVKKGRPKKDITESPIAVSSDNLSEKPVPPKKTVTPRKKTLLGLDIVDIMDDPISSVRQSRRLASIKIKEEADRRKIDDFTLLDIKVPSPKKKLKKENDKDYKTDDKADRKEKRKRAKLEIPSDTNTSSNEGSKQLDEAKKLAKKRKHKNPKFDGLHPWKSSSDSDSESHPEEEEEEEVEYEEEPPLLFGSDHEFSMESEEDNDQDFQPIKRARTVRKEDAVEEAVDHTNCNKCGKSDHPEWILLCDGCDSGWHCSCLLPALFVIPEGDWYCPPCQHKTLIKNLENELIEFDKKLIKREVEVRRKERLAYVGISLDNVLPSKEHESKKRSGKHMDSESDQSSSSSSSDSEDEPIYQLRQRRQAHSYRFNDYDDLINSAIQHEVDAVAGNQGRGKDIATIVDAKNEDEEEKLPPVVPANSDLPSVIPQDNDGSDNDIIKPKQRFGKKKHRKLNSLDDSSGEDRDSDEDFKGSDDDDEDEEFEETDSDDSNRGHRAAVRRSGRARVSRFDREFINDNSEDDAPKRRKRSIWDESESEEESDASWGRRKKRSGGSRRAPAYSSSKKKRSKKKKKKNLDDSDVEVFRRKKPKIVYGGLETDEEEEEIGPRTRGKKINYIDALGSDTDEDVRRKNAIKDDDSEEEFVLNEEEDMPDDEVERDSDDSNSTPLSLPKQSVPIKAYVKKGKGKGGIKRIKRAQGEEEEALFPPLPESDEKEEPDRPEKTAPVVTTTEITKVIPEVPIPDTIEEMNKNFEEMGEKEMEMMMEEEEYANKQLQMVAMQLEKERRRRELEAQKIIIPIPPPEPEPEHEMLSAPPAPAAVPVHIPVIPTVVEEKTPKKRGRKPKSVVTSPETTMLQAAPSILHTSPSLLHTASSLLHTAPSLLHTAPSMLHTIPSTQHTTPSMLHTAPSTLHTAPSMLQTTPSLLQTEPSLLQTTPAILQTTPAILQTTPAILQTIPAILQTTPATLQTTPSLLLPNPSSAQISPDDMGRQSEDGDMGGQMPTMLLNLDGTPKKRRGRGKGRKTLEKEAAAAAAKSSSLGISGTSSTSMASRDSNDSSDQPIPKTVETALSSSSKTSSPAESPLLGGKLGVAAAPQPFSQSQPMPSVITRMLQSQPGQASYPVGAMAHKYYDDRPEGPPPLGSGGPPAGSPFMGNPGGPRGVLPGPPGPGYRPQINHYPVVRSGPPPPHRLRSPGPQNLPPHMYHPHPAAHHAIDASSSSVGPLPLTTDRSSPSLASPSAGSPLRSKGDPTPPPPGYIRPAMNRFPPITNAPIPRNPLMLPQHLQQPRPNLPYHPGMPPNFHYGHYPPVIPPNISGEDGPPAPNQFQNAPPYPEQFSEGSSDGPKNYDEENGEFGGLVSYFSSQREDDDLDT